MTALDALTAKLARLAGAPHAPPPVAPCCTQVATTVVAALWPHAVAVGLEDGWADAVAFLRRSGTLGARDAADDLEAEGARRAARVAAGAPIGEPEDWPGDETHGSVR